MPTKTPGKLFNLEEANRLLPTLTRLVEMLQHTYAELVVVAKRYTPEGTELDLAAVLQEHGTKSIELAEPVKRMQAIIAEIEAFGCEFKGLEMGLVDFPAIIGDDVAFLCWQYGEPSIQWWHTLDGGFQGRRPLKGTVPVGRLN